jgi:hypothetical protein
MKTAGEDGVPTSETTPVEGAYAWEPIDADGVAIFRLLTSAPFTLDLARVTIADLIALTGGKRVPIVADIRRSKGMTAEARAFFGNPNPPYSALAILAGSPVTRMIANFFIGLNRPSVPTQIFTDEGKARAWSRRHAV